MDSDNQRIARFLTRYRFRCEPFSKDELTRSKTPDFRVFQGSNLAFFCEVKSIEQDRWLDDQLSEALSGELAGGLQHDPVYNRVSNKVHEAVQQFDAVNLDRTRPNVLVFVNRDRMADYNDLGATLTGGIPLERGGTFWGFSEYSDGRIREEKYRIDLYIWLDIWLDENCGKRKMYFTQAHEGHYDKLLGLLRIERAIVKQMV
jgi:hypothetical protein